MGYYTKFDVSENEEFVVGALMDISGYAHFDGVKWYNWQKDLVRVSEMFPDQLIRISGVGEGDGIEIDIWEAYAKNGKFIINVAELVFPKVDLSSLD
jgi:hypothetical protein